MKNLSIPQGRLTPVAARLTCIAGPRAWLPFDARGPWRRRVAPLVLTLAALLAAAGARLHAQVCPPDWNYHGATGPEHWCGTCSNGLRQTPIDFSTGTLQRVSSLPSLQFNYGTSVLLDVTNNEHTVQANVPHGHGAITVDGTNYGLAQFHWHTPSEHTVQGAARAMEMHLVHTHSVTNGTNVTTHLAVVGVFIVEGGEHQGLASIFTNLPPIPAHGGSRARSVANFDLTTLLPAPDGGKSYRYDGSLTTPGCGEGVNWTVLTQPLQMSSAQINAFRAMFQTDEHGEFPHGNARPVQPLNGRVVQTDAPARDVTPPRIFYCPPTFVLDVPPMFLPDAPPDACTVALPDLRFIVGAEDDCTISENLIRRQTPPPGILLPGGIHLVTVDILDEAGNASSCMILVTVTVNDTVPPTIICPPNLVVNSSPGLAGSNVTFTVTASDNCGTANVACTPASGSLFPLGTTPVTCLAEDGHGNTNTCAFTVTVSDATPPTITCPPNLVVTAATYTNGICGSNVTFIVTATASGGGPASVTCSPASGSLFPLGTNTVTCTAVDGNANAHSCSFTVTVNEFVPIIDWGIESGGFFILRWTPSPCGSNIVERTSHIEANPANTVWVFETELNPVVLETTNSSTFYRVRVVPFP